MKRWCGGAIFLVISIISIAGCATNQDALDRDKSDNYTQSPGDGITEENLGGDFGEFQFGDDAHWPDYIPVEIPELPGQIRTIMVAPKSHIRLFYSNVSDEQIEEYLALLVDQGFELQFRIHVQEGFPDNSEERRQRGEYDDIDITKGEYHMTLSYWEGTATYDVYTSGFQEIVEEATAITWPDALDGVLPPPERCKLVTINPYGRDGYYITCKREDQQVDQDYLDLLASLGFQIQEVIENSQGEIVLLRLRSGDLVVDLTPAFGMYFSMQVSVEPLPQWPEVFNQLVPKPKGCELTAIIPTLKEDDHYITCNPEDENVLLEYVHVLEELGFDERDKFLGQNDQILIITLDNGIATVRLSYDSPDSMSVNVLRDEP
ncbi:MAG: hypothetical protein U9N80_03005 [Chloroflexota bacterium]|nr:hypothetical protein [Chloroflexota bacterium]